jgi:hypothetical protein
MDLNILLDTPPWEWPKDAGRTFRKVLKDRLAKPSDRLIAAELAGDFTVIDNDLANVLLNVLRDSTEPDDLRAQAAISFGAALEVAWTEIDEDMEEFDDPEMVPISVGQFRTIQETLRRIYSDAGTPKLVRRRALEGSVRAPQDWHQDAIREAYATGDPEWVLTAVFAMHYVRGFEKETLEALQSTDPEIHFEAVVGAGSKELDAAWPHVLGLATHAGTEKDLRIAAIGAIGAIRPGEASPFLLELADSEDEDIAGAADEALSMSELLPDDEAEEEEEDGDESIN